MLIIEALLVLPSTFYIDARTQDHCDRVDAR